MAIDTVIPVEPVGPARRPGRVVFVWIFAGIALAAAITLSIVAGRPEIGLAAGLGLVVPLALVLFLRARNRRRRQPAPVARGRRWVGPAVLIVVAVGLVAASTLLLNRPDAMQGAPPGGVPVQTVSYHAQGRIVGAAVVLTETIVLNEGAMSALSTRPKPDPADSTSDATSDATADEPVAPSAAVAGWQEAGLVDGFSSFTRTREIPWDETSTLADTVTVPLSIIGYLSGRGEMSGVALMPQDGSRVEFVLPKEALGAAQPAPASQTDVPGRGGESVVFAVDNYVSNVSFDLLAAPLRNSAGHTLYNASESGFWKWAAGAAITVIGGFLVDKIAGAIWQFVLRRVRSLFGRPKKAEAV